MTGLASDKKQIGICYYLLGACAVKYAHQFFCSLNTNFFTFKKVYFATFLLLFQILKIIKY